MARCPAHADRTPSLSIRMDGDRLLIHCFAGCPAESVLDAVGLRFSDIYGDPWRAARERACAAPVRLPPLDPLELERRIIQIALADWRAGAAMSAEDVARVELARERLRAAGVQR